eukprot:8671181-Pyramimonas_sp.AAC.2
MWGGLHRAAGDRRAVGRPASQNTQKASTRRVAGGVQVADRVGFQNTFRGGLAARFRPLSARYRPPLDLLRTPYGPPPDPL